LELDGLVNKIKVPYEFLEACAEQYCAHQLDMHEPSKSKGKVIAWKNHHWVCTGAASQYLKYLEAELQMCVPEAGYHGPPNDPEAGPGLYYVGGRFTCKGQVWVMTDKEIRLVPIDERRDRERK
jgi:hypothetical protein